jgi:hypothetical protein
MLAIFCSFVLSSKLEVELAVKYSSACPGSTDSHVIVDNRDFPVQPALYGSTFVRLHPGKHILQVSHPWCSFPDVILELNEDGTFRASSNFSSTEKYPIVIRHLDNSETDILSKLTNSPMMLFLLLVPIAMFVCRQIVSSPKVQAKLQQWQQDMLQAQEQARQAH